MTPSRPATSRVKVHIAVFRYAKYRANLEKQPIAIVDGPTPEHALMTLQLNKVLGDRVHQIVHPDEEPTPCVK